jgi:hypothetical protein
VPLVDTRERVITVTAYRVDNIMSPLGKGDITLMREAFPEVPTGGLVPAAGEVSLLMGQDNLSLFPMERRRVGNAALYMSWFGTGWIASGKPQRAKEGGNSRHVGVRGQPGGDGLAGTARGGYGDLRAINGVPAVGVPALAHRGWHFSIL